MTAAEIVKKLEALGSESYKKVMRNHGVPEPFFGVKIEDLKKILKQVRKDHRLALDLFDTGIYDAMYLGGLIADETKMTKNDLRRWLKKANCAPLCEYAVAKVAAESRHGLELALEWIDSAEEQAAATGWATLSGLVAIKDDADLDLPELKRLLQRVERTIHEQPDRVRYSMNTFVISVGGYVRELTEAAIQAAGRIGPVSVDMGKTACKVPSAKEYIRKMQQRGSFGKKRKAARC